MKNQKYNFESKRNDYLTPPELIEKILKKIDANKFWGDVCCSQPNIPALFYAVDGRVDGLKVSWNYKDYGILEENIKPYFGLYWVYCNPPYDTCGAWVKKAYEEQQKGANSVLLVPARTETKFWHDYIFGEDGFGFKEGVEVQFLRKGICFLNPDTGEKIKMKVGLKDKKGKPIIDELTGEQAFKLVDGVYKNSLALVYFRGRE